MIDTHCHLDLECFDEDREEILSRAEASGFDRFIIPGIEFATIEKIKQLAEEHENIRFASGIHPNNAADLPEKWLERVRKDALHPKCAAIGEIGMDYYREYCPHDVQRSVFTAQLELAGELELPAIVHCREAYEDLCPILFDWIRGNPQNKAVIHAFDCDKEKAMEAVSLGIMIGIGGTYTYTKKNERRTEILKTIPLSSILTETDCPYLTPHPYRGKRNEPAYASFTVQKIAEIKGISFEAVAEQTTLNAERFFKRIKTD